MKNARLPLLVLVLVVLWSSATLAETFGSIEPIASTSVFDMRPLLDRELRVRVVFARKLFRCGIVRDVEDLLASEQVTTTIDDRNTHFQVAGGGFAGNTNPTYALTAIDSGPDAVSVADIGVLTDSLGFVMTQDSVFLLDGASTPARRGVPGAHSRARPRGAPPDAARPPPLHAEGPSQAPGRRRRRRGRPVHQEPGLPLNP